MKKSIQYLPMMIVLLSVYAVFAKTPIRYTDTYSLGVEYRGLWRGQYLESNNNKYLSYDKIHLVDFYYAPVEFVQIGIGLGASKIKITSDPMYGFDGEYGFTFSGALNLYTPAFVGTGIFRVSGGGTMNYLLTEHDNDTGSSGDDDVNDRDDDEVTYRGPIVQPFISLIIQAGPYIDIEGGFTAKVAFLTYKDTLISRDVENSNLYCGFANLTIHSPQGSYLQFHFAATPEFGTDWDDGPMEAEIGFSIGTIIRKDWRSKKLYKTRKKYFPEYERAKVLEEDLITQLEEEKFEEE